MGAELNKALAGLQAELAPIKRNAKGQTGTREHRYADLAAVSDTVLPLLSKHDLAFSARPTLGDDGHFVLAYSLLHASGEREDGQYPLGTGTPQQLGSAITYARRYCLCAVTGATPVGEDDDGAAAADVRQGRQPQRQRPPSRPTAQPVHTRTTGTEHERLRHGTVEATPDDRAAERTRGPVPDEQNLWQDVPPEELPGSYDPKDVQKIQIAYGKLGFDSRTDRAQLLGISEQIIGRSLGVGPGPRSHNNLSHEEARKLRDTLEGFQGDRGALMERLTGITQAVAAVGAQDDAEGSQEGTDE
jgi:hypothetical protein